MRTNFIALLLLVLFSVFSTISQISIHQEELEKYDSIGHLDASYYESLPYHTAPTNKEKASCTLNKMVYGWHPYWGGNTYQTYNWDLLSHMSFFSYEVNYANGNAVTNHGWGTSAAVTAALASGNTKVTLCVTLFANHATFLSNTTSRQTLINNLISLVSTRGAHGVNIDFEGIPSAQRANFASFMVQLANQMHAAIPNSEVSTVLYAVDWNSVFDITTMNAAVDYYIIMGYDYYWSGSTTCGPNDPLYQFGTSYNYTLSKSITYYLNLGCPKNKLVLGLPYYGREWATSSLIVPGTATASGVSRTFKTVKDNSAGYYSAGSYQWDGSSFTDIYAFNNGGARQCYITKENAFEDRLAHVLRSGIRGIGIWALGYDDGYSSLWSAIENNLTTCYQDPCTGSIFDFGGPTKNYNNNENYTWTISPPSASSITVNFSSFFMELNYDYLYIYDGNSTSAAQIAGSPFTGTNSPGSFTSSTGSLTFRFTSDGATVGAGFLASYTCNTLQPPISNFSISNTVICARDSIQLQNSSSGATSYLWSASSGSFSNSTAENPYFYPIVSGNCTISLIASNSQGSSTINSNVAITVEPAPIASFTASSTTLIYPSTVVSFSNMSENATDFLWDFAGGVTSTQINESHNFDTVGVYSVSLIAYRNGCQPDTFSVTIFIDSPFPPPQPPDTTQNIDSTNSINYIKLNSLEVYPNPAKNQLFVKGANISNYQLLDLFGKIIKKEEEVVSDNFELDLSDYSAGIYFLSLKQGGLVKNVKLIIEQ